MRRSVLVLCSVLAATAYAQEPADRAGRGASPQAHGYRQGDLDETQRTLASLRANARLDADTSRVRLLQEPAKARKAIQNSENRRRCEAALKVAALCGTYAGRFSCDETGFRPASPAESMGFPAASNNTRYEIKRCELQARRGAN